MIGPVFSPTIGIRSQNEQQEPYAEDLLELCEAALRAIEKYRGVWHVRKETARKRYALDRILRVPRIYGEKLVRISAGFDAIRPRILCVNNCMSGTDQYGAESRCESQSHLNLRVATRTRWCLLDVVWRSNAQITLTQILFSNQRYFDNKGLYVNKIMKLVAYIS